MNRDSFIDRVKNSDQAITMAYEELNATTFKGSSKEMKISVKMRGNFELEDFQNPENLEGEKLKQALIEAVNDAIDHIKKDRHKIARKIIENEWSDFK